MMKITGIFLLGVFCFTLPSRAATENMRFTYQPMEDLGTECTHKQIRDLPDWDVACETPYGLKKFSAHVVVRENHRGEEKTGLEVLYWVTAPGDTETSPRKYSSTSALIGLSGKTKLEDFTFSQGIENDAAYLSLDWKRNGKKAGKRAR